MRALPLVLLLIPAALLMAVFTESGTRGLISVIAHVLPVEIEYTSGSLSDRLVVERLRYEMDTTHIEVDGLEIALNPACLLRSAICFRQLHARNLDVTLLDSPDEEEDTERIVFPVILETDNLDIEALRIHWSDGEWQQKSTQGSVRIRGSLIEVLSATIVEPRLELRDSANEDLSDATATVLPGIDLPFELVVTTLQLTRPHWDFYGTAYEQDSIVLAGHWLNHVLDISVLEVDDSELGELSMRGELEFIDNWPVHVSANVHLASPLPGPELFGQKFGLAVQGDLASLVLQLTGHSRITSLVEAQINVLESELPFSATLTATSADELSLGDLEGMPAFLAGAKLTFPLTASVDGSLSSQQFELNAAATGLGYDALRLIFTGRHASGTLDITQLSLLDVAGESELHATGEVVIAENIGWSVALHTNGLDLPDVGATVHGRIAGALQSTGELYGSQWRVNVHDVQLRGDVNGMPAHVSGYAGLNSDLQLSNSQLQAEINAAEFSLIKVGAEHEPGRLTLSVPDLGHWQSGSRGQIQLDVLASPDRQNLQLSGDLKNVLWQGLSFDRGTITAKYHADTNHSFQFDTAFSDVAIGDIDLQSVSLSAKGDAARQSVSLLSQGAIQGELALTGTLRDQKWEGKLASTTLETPIGLWQLSESLGLAWSDTDQQLALEKHCWMHEYAQLCPGQWVLGPSGGGRIALSGDMKLFAGLLSPGLDLEGDLQSQLEARWVQDGDITVEGQLQTRALTVVQHFEEGESTRFGWDTGDVSFSYDRNGLRLKGDLQQGGRNIAALSLQLPPDRTDSITGSIGFDQLQLSTLAPLLPVVSSLSGDITGQLALSGTVDQPLAQGRLALVDGRMIMAGNPTELDKLGLTLDVHGDQAQIRGSGTLGGGELSLAGQLTTHPELRLELTVKGHKQTILYPPSTELKVSEELQLVLASNLLDIEGDITVHKGLLEIQQLPEDSVSISSSVVEVDYDGNVLREELPFDTRINVDIHIQNNLKVTGSGYQATLGGELEVKQRPGHPLQLFGNLRTIGGELYAYQSHLKIKGGTISFSGPPANPMLDLSAERHIAAGNVTVGVRVQGPLEDDLELTLYSDPTMSQTETLSYLVRGRGMDVGAGGDGTALALSLASGVVNRSTLVSELNRIPGINNVAFGAQGSENDTAATVSGYIGERIYLSYGIGFYEPINVLTARLYLRTRIWLEVVSSIENSVDLYYSFDID